jgi:undecaprenyl-phosphate galactose phosphotransferase
MRGSAILIYMEVDWGGVPEGVSRPPDVRRRGVGPWSAAAGSGDAASPESGPAISAGSRALKRSFDIALSLVLIIVSLPLIMIIALAIEVESPGSVFFAHRRLGKGGTEFGLIKFRTMVPDAEARLQTHLHADPDQMAEWNARYKLRNDPRVTRVGRVLRKTSLDELPQLFNVLMGTVSLVGPRAIVREEVGRFGAYAPTILSIKPGMTGLWAVSGRSEVSHRERALLEYRYVMERSFLLDLRILLRTIPAVLHGHGAY